MRLVAARHSNQSRRLNEISCGAAFNELCRSNGIDFGVAFKLIVPAEWIEMEVAAQHRQKGWPNEEKKMEAQHRQTSRPNGWNGSAASKKSPAKKKILVW